MAHSRLALLAVVALLTGGCDALGIGEVCTLELRSRFTPPDTAIQIGQRFQASVQLSSCGGSKRLRDAFTWRTEDPAVATVDPVSGSVLGEGPGTTRILASGERYGSVGGLEVTVQATQ